MTPDQIPQELIDILDRNAGRKHARTGSVIRTLAEILTAYDQLKASGKRFPTPAPTPEAPTDA